LQCIQRSQIGKRLSKAKKGGKAALGSVEKAVRL
jgi:hypothetical protein